MECRNNLIEHNHFSQEQASAQKDETIVPSSHDQLMDVLILGEEDLAGILAGIRKENLLSA